MIRLAAGLGINFVFSGLWLLLQATHPDDKTWLSFLNWEGMKLGSFYCDHISQCQDAFFHILMFLKSGGILTSISKESFREASCDNIVITCKCAM